MLLSSQDSKGIYEINSQTKPKDEIKHNSISSMNLELGLEWGHGLWLVWGWGRRKEGKGAGSRGLDEYKQSGNLQIMIF